MAKRKPEEAPPGAPAWQTTFADLMNLLLCFFVLLFSMSTVDAQKFEIIAASFSNTFSIFSGGANSFKDGLLISITDGEGNALDYLTKDDLTVGTFDYGQALYTRYVELQNLLANYSEDKTTAAYLGYLSNLQRIQDK